MLRRILLFLCLLAALGNFAGAQTDAWLEVRTPHFDVISNAPETDARRAAGQFERMRAAFRGIFPNTNIDTAAPIVVLAVEDKRNLKLLEPAVYLGKGQLNPVGLFLHTSDNDYVLVWLNAPGLHPYAPVYHEYTHFVLSRTGEWIPLWLNEGYAQFYQTTEILDGEVVVGKLDAYAWDFLQRNPLLPLPTLFAVDEHSPYYHQEDQASMFYAESWALTHYLKAKDTRENTHRLRDYLDLVHQQVDTVAAATQAFGDLSQLQADLKKYIVNGDYDHTELPAATDIDASSFAVRTLTQSQADTVRAGFLARVQRASDARTLLEAVLRDDPSNASARETMGYLAFRDGHFDEAEQWFEQAVKYDPQSSLAHYYFAIAALKKGLPAASGQSGIENNLRTAIQLNPSFAPAYAGLGVFFAMRGRDNGEAHQWVQKAIQLDPGDVEFRVDDAKILMRMKRKNEAVQTLDLALKMAHTPEQIAAVQSALQSARQPGTSPGAVPKH